MLTYKKFLSQLNEESLNEVFNNVKNVINVKNKYNNYISSSHDYDARNLTCNQIIHRLARYADPTPSKVHLGWIADQYENGNIKLKDSHEIRKALIDFGMHQQEIKNDEARSKIIGVPIDNRNHAFNIPMTDINHYDDLDHLNGVLDNYRNNAFIPTTDIGVNKDEIRNAINGGYWSNAHNNIAISKILDHARKHGDHYGAHKDFLTSLNSFNSVKDKYKKALSDHLSQTLLSGHPSMSEIYKAKADDYWNDKIHNKNAADGLSKLLRSGISTTQHIKLAKTFGYWDEDRHMRDMSIGLLRKMQGPPKNKLKKAGIGIASGIFKVAKAYVKFAGKH